jgi:adenosylmethionine-8-amino-7-oxononanoate aminotransferase
MKDHESLPMIPIARGDGVWLHDFDGRRYLDGISSWWVNLFGHANPRIIGAVRAQLERLEHVMLAASRTSRSSNCRSGWCGCCPRALRAVSMRTTGRPQSRSRSR